MIVAKDPSALSTDDTLEYWVMSLLIVPGISSKDAGLLARGMEGMEENDGGAEIYLPVFESLYSR